MKKQKMRLVARKFNVIFHTTSSVENQAHHEKISSKKGGGRKFRSVPPIDTHPTNFKHPQTSRQPKVRVELTLIHTPEKAITSNRKPTVQRIEPNLECINRNLLF